MNTMTTFFNNKKYVIREAIENKKHLVIEVYYNEREYPNIISGRYTSIKTARHAILENIKSNKEDKFTFFGNI